jgi:tetratricopeptide (TPR) repeat protein
MNCGFRMRTLLMFGRVLALALALVGCSRQQPRSESIPVIRNDEEHNRYCKEASDLVMPYCRLTDGREKPSNTPKVQTDLQRGIALYKAVVTYAPSNWSAYWFMGKAYQALREPTAACEAFGTAYSIQKENVDIAREFMFECLEIGRTSEGVAAAEHAVSLKPRDAGLLANLALAYTIAGRTSEALSKVEESLSIDPTDKITVNLKRVIREIIEGKRPQPKKLSDLSSG